MSSTEHPSTYDAELDEELGDGDARIRASRRWWVIGGVLIAAAVALMTWIGLANAHDDPVSYRDIAFTVDSPAQVTSRFEVTKPKDSAVTCLVRALDKTYGVVGTLDVTIPAGEETVVRTVRIRTTSLAVTGTVRSCSLVP